MKRMRGLTRADFAVLLAIGLLMCMGIPTLFAQSFSRARELANRRACSANLGEIAKALKTYAAGHDGQFPGYKPTAVATYSVAIKPDEGGKSAEETLATLHQDNSYSDNPSAALWILVLNGQVSQKLFVCPSDPFDELVTAQGSTPASGPATTPTTTRRAGMLEGQPAKFYRNFQNPNQISYSSAYPWTQDVGDKPVFNGLWRDTDDSSLPLLSDLAPYLGAKEDPATRPAGGNPEKAPEAVWAVRRANSQNHQFEGQYVGYADAHVEFLKTPAAGQADDSIWGIRVKTELEPVDRTEVPIEAGKLPHPPTRVLGNSLALFDVVMVPTRDAKGNLK